MTSMSSVALGGILGATAVGSVPSSLAPGASGLRTGYAQGLGKIGSTLPAMGSIKGTTMVLKATKKLKKKSRSFF